MSDYSCHHQSRAASVRECGSCGCCPTMLYPPPPLARGCMGCIPRDDCCQCRWRPSMRLERQPTASMLLSTCLPAPKHLPWPQWQHGAGGSPADIGIALQLCVRRGWLVGISTYISPPGPQPIWGLRAGGAPSHPPGAIGSASPWMGRDPNGPK